VLVYLTQKRREGKAIHGITKSEWEEILRYANAAGALTCTRAGAMTAIPTQREVVKFLSNI
jgi:fructokinase